MLLRNTRAENIILWKNRNGKKKSRRGKEKKNDISRNKIIAQLRRRQRDYNNIVGPTRRGSRCNNTIAVVVKVPI